MAQKILVLDDEENYAEMLESLLEQHFFIVDSAVKPEEALKALEQKGYDLVISDYKMPVMDGADFLQKAREINPDLPFIIVSGLMNTPELVKVANMGVTLVLEKPIDIDNFISQVRKFVEPVSEEEYSRSRTAEESGPVPVGDGRKFIKTYPGDCKYISDKSPVMQFFLQDLWDSIQEQNHIFVRMPAGSEIELLLAEVNHWKGLDPENALMLDAGAAIGSSAQKLAALGSIPDCGLSIGVTGFAKAGVAEQASLVDCIREADEKISFIYFIEETVLDHHRTSINAELVELLGESLCHMPPLFLRPADLAVYLKRFLAPSARAEQVPEPAGFSPEAAASLLAYAWPGNFTEMLAVLRTLAIQAEGGEISQSQVDAILQGGKANEPSGLGIRLQMAQARFLTEAIHKGRGSLGALLETSGISEAADKYDQVDDIPLLFPDLAGNP